MKRLSWLPAVALALLPAAAWAQCTEGWSTGSAAPYGVLRSVGGYWDGQIFVIGGYEVSKGTVAYTQIYDIATETWTSGEPLSTRGEGMCGGVYNGKVYLFGGYSSDLLTATQIYDIANDTWSAGQDMPVGSWGCQAGAIDGIFYVAGGTQIIPIDTLQAYDIAADTWDSSLAGLPVTQTFGGGANGDGLLYTVSGRINGGIAAALYAYDPTAGTWNALTPNNTARYNPGVINADGKIYAFFGGSTGSDQWVPRTTCEVYDITGDTWADFASPSEPVVAPQVAHSPGYGGLLFVVGGRNSNKISVPTNRIYTVCLADVTAIEPNTTAPGVEANVVISGFGFEAGDTAYLSEGAKTEYALADLSIDDEHTISGVVTDDVPIGVYNVVVESQSGEIDMLEDGFEVAVPGDDDDDDDDSIDDDDSADDDDDGDDDDDDDSGCCG